MIKKNNLLLTQILTSIYNIILEIDRDSYLVIVGMVYTTIFFCSFVMGYKTIYLYGRILCASVFIFPLLFPINDAITELLGYKVSYLMILVIVFCEFIFSFITHTLAILPSPSNWKEQALYPIITNGFIHICIANSISLAIGFVANTYFMSKWGIRWFGSGFFIRSLGATAIGELLFTISTNIIAFHIIGKANMIDTINIILSDYSIKMLYSFVICIPNTYLVTLIKNYKQTKHISPDNNQLININKVRAGYRS